ncbi:MAG: T9SS type A sorting domain-containing protein [Bacteroidetes bacterium]|nr:T9SS type A sorting domain-containing protein [Bacteroidota bacterium]
MNRLTCSLLIALAPVLSTLLYAQTSATAQWPLTTNRNAIVVGEINALSQQLVMMQEVYINGVQRTSPVGTAGTWPNEATENPTRYIQFAVTPLRGNSLTVTTLSMFLYVNSGSGMRANVYYSKDYSFSSKVQIGSTIALSSAIPSSPNVTASVNLSIQYLETLYVRIYPWYVGGTTGKYLIVNSMTISGTTFPTTAILIAPRELNGFVQPAVDQPSNVLTYTIQGINLSYDVAIVPPQGFQLSTDGGRVWTNAPVSLPVSNGIIVNQPVVLSVRMLASHEGLHSGIISHASLGVPEVNLTVEGIVLASEPTVAGTLSVVSLSGTTATFSFKGGNGTRRLVVLNSGTTLSWRPTDGVPITGVNANYIDALDQGNGCKVVYNGEDTVVTVTGLSSNTTYTAAVFEYNVSTGNSYNYLTLQFPVVTFTTPKVAVFSVLPTTLNYGSVLVGKSLIKKCTLSGMYLSENGAILVAAPNGFTVSGSEQGPYSSTITISYTGELLQQTTLYIRFEPTEKKVYSGRVTIASGDAYATLAVLGTGVTTLVQTEMPVGFATCGNVTGGLGGTIVTVTTPQELANLMKAREGKSTTPLIVYIAGTLSGYSTEISVKRTANISILGIGENAGFSGFGMKVVECNNIIIRNLTFADCHVDEKDALAIDASYNVWIDHCTFTDSPAYDPSGSTHDGQLDVKNGSYNVTISYNRFMNHRKTCLLGHTPGQVSDTVMKVTYYRNWFDGTYSRHPRIRYAKAHIVNNLYTNVGGYGVGVTCDAQVYLEANVFENTPYPVLISQVNDAEGTLSGDPPGYIKAVGNLTVNSGSIVENLAKYNFSPSDYYLYDVVPATEVKSLVQENAGAGKLVITNVAHDAVTQKVPTSCVLYQNYPNPFNPSTRMVFSIPTSATVSLVVYDIMGRVIAPLFSGNAEGGKVYEVLFNALHLPSGVYFGILETNGQRITRKLILIK